MNHHRVFRIAGVFCAALLQAEVKLPALISDHMVLQQNQPIRIWGKADPGEAVTVSFRGRRATAKADSGGKWAVSLKPLKAAAPAEMTITGANKLRIQDVLVGEVWVGSGQSNMALSVGSAQNADEELANANFPMIRLFEVKHVVADTPQDDVVGAWTLCTPETARKTSAAGYFFSRDLHRKLKAPVGFIHSSWGGTPAQAWTSRQALDAEPSLKFVKDAWDKTLASYPAAHARYEQQLADWKKLAAAAKAEGKTAPQQPRPPAGPGSPYTPAGLYNAMIAPLTPFAIRGVIWYQGEANANAEQAYPYRKLFRTMIEDWRRQWREGAFPFLFVQLPNFQPNQYWPVLRESQADVVSLRNTGMAVVIDVGEPTNIHPKNKQAVGQRLALAARAIAYREKIVYSGPIYRQAHIVDGQVRLSFDHVGGGLAARGGAELTGFKIAGADGKFVPAQARIEGKTIVVKSAEVAAPAAVRYAWEGDPVCNLINKEGLPASPFRTDRWEIK
jgi:sialate O-acetylesterase